MVTQKTGQISSKLGAAREDKGTQGTRSGGDNDYYWGIWDINLGAWGSRKLREQRMELGGLNSRMMMKN